MFRATALGAIFVLASTAALLAQECDRNDESQSGMNICAQEDYEKADAALNKVYGKVVGALSDDAHAKDLLKKSQRAWIAFRDAECDFQTVDNEGGTIYPMVYVGCQQSLTEARTKQLQSVLDCSEGNGDCEAQ